MIGSKDYLTVEDVRSEIPLTKKYIYLDSAATSLVPQTVINKMNEYLLEYGVNIERGAYFIANRANEEWDRARKDTANLLLNCNPEEMIFTRNLTQTSNIVAYSLINPKIKFDNNKIMEYDPIINWKKNDEIVTTIIEHHSNILAWMRLAYLAKCKFKIIKELPKNGEINSESIMNNLSDKTKFVAFQHCSNVFGTKNNVTEIVKSIKKEYPECIVYIDGSQGPGHMPVDVNKIKCDFYGFSGHKGPLGPPGTGGLFVKKEIIEKMEPLEIGGGIISDVSYDQYKIRKDYPSKRFDAGTPNILGMIGLGEGARYVSKRIGLERILNQEKKLIKYLLENLTEINGLEIYGPLELDKKSGLVTFNLKDWRSHDLSLTLDENWKILTRAGHHCALPASKWLGIKDKYGGNVRISVHYYNTINEIETAIDALKKLSK
jgi:cysteine desulfurase/selenocysteine lyase